jgi:hypothetical protein
VKKPDAPRAGAHAIIMSYGVRVEVRSDTPRFLRELLERLPPGWKRIRAWSAHRVFTVPESSSASENQQALDRFEAEVKLFVAEMARGRLFVHAGAVGWRGRAVILPAPTLSGKSTLVAALVRAGATYYSDEYAVLDARGRVHPYPRALALRDRKTRKQRPHPVTTLGGRSGRKPLPVGTVIITQYARGERWRPRKLTPGQGLLALLANTVPARRDPRRTLAVLRRAVARAEILDGRRGEARLTARSILGLITSPRAHFTCRQSRACRA